MMYHAREWKKAYTGSINIINKSVQIRIYCTKRLVMP